MRSLVKPFFVSGMIGLGAVVFSADKHAVYAAGTLKDAGVLVQSFPGGGNVLTPMSAENDGTFIWTASGANNFGQRLTRHLQDGTVDLSFATGIDFRSLYADNFGQLFAKAFGSGNVYSLTQSGIPTLLYTLSDPDPQSSASLNADDTQLYTRSGSTIRRYDAGSGGFLGQFTLIGMTPAELGFPDRIQMETNDAGRIFTYSNGVVSEWDLSGARIGTSTIPIATPTAFNTEWSFSVGNDNVVYLFNNHTMTWESYDIGIAAIQVSVDIKPGSDPNSINCEAETGVIPVAVLTTGDFDATTVGHATVTFEAANEAHVKNTTGEPARHEEDVDFDGDIDLVFHFRLGDTALDCDSTEGTLTGETLHGSAIEGTDAVLMVHQ